MSLNLLQMCGGRLVASYTRKTTIEVLERLPPISVRRIGNWVTSILLHCYAPWSHSNSHFATLHVHLTATARST